MHRVILYLAGLIAGCLLSSTSQAEQAARRPNVILFVTDDQGTLDMNCYGAKDLLTPTMDALAKRGLRFTQFYVNAPVCSPSRAGILTGRDHTRAGVAGNVSSEDGHVGLPATEITLAKLLKQAGYRTALYGKWHLGTVPESEPNAHGFDEFYGFKAGCVDNYSHFFYWSGPHFHDLWHNQTEVWENGTHLSDIMVREAKRFMAADKSQPFFMYFAVNLPHYPKQTAYRFYEMYKDLPEPRRSYAATISCIDDSLNQLLNQLEALKIRQDTLIILFSDHGHSTEERTGYGGGYAGPYRGAKFSVLEGGIRVPCIVSWPGVIPEGEVRDQLALSLDWFPTVAELCGVKLPDRKLDGVSIVPLLKSKGEVSPHKVVHWQLGKQWAVREGDWKLVVNGNDTSDKKLKYGKLDAVFLSNLALDVTETKNLAAQNPEIVQRLTKLHEEWEVGLKQP